MGDAVFAERATDSPLLRSRALAVRRLAGGGGVGFAILLAVLTVSALVRWSRDPAA